jgi:hypothetical protein
MILVTACRSERSYSGQSDFWTSFFKYHTECKYEKLTPNNWLLDWEKRGRGEHVI